MSLIVVALGVVLASMLVSVAVRHPSVQLKAVSLGGAVLILLIAFALASFRYVSEGHVGVVSKNVGLRSLAPGKIIATNGEKGPQARILPPGWNPGYWPFIYNVDYSDVIVIPAGQIGLLSASDGLPLPAGMTYAPEWPDKHVSQMAQNAKFFLTEGKGHKGPQESVLKPGSYRINPNLFTITIVPVTTIEKATVGVVKSNVGDRPEVPGTDTDLAGARRLVKKGQRGIWGVPLLEGQYYLNSNAMEVTKVSTKKHIVRYAADRSARTGGSEEREIIVRTSDGFTFPVDVRIEYEIRPGDAPLLVSTVGDDQAGLRAVMNSAVRAIFRNNAEGVKALAYVKQRSGQESQSLTMLKAEMDRIGVTISGVRIGDVGDEATLGSLLKTQTDREIALQEQETFKEQERAAEQKKALTKTEQEAEEEKRLATAHYEVKIAEQHRERVVIEAEAEARAVHIKAEAQAEAYKKIAEQIGKGNAALIELLKIVGENGVSITPRVMVIGDSAGGAGQGGQTTALIGTMLDSMLDKSSTEEKK